MFEVKNIDDTNLLENPVIALMSKYNHEQLLFCNDNESGLKAIIAIHNTILGPALGGTRMWMYKNEQEALTDVLRLSRGMTYKNAISGLNLGGGKAVIIGDSKTMKSEALFRRFGKFVQSLGGKYITAEDVGISPLDMTYVHMETNHVVGLPGKSGDPSPITAYGVYMGMKAAAKVQFGSDSLNGKKISVVELRLPFIVSAVDEKSANKNTVQPKDIVTSFNGVPVKYADQVVTAVKELKGKTVPAIIKRDNQEIAVSIVVNDSAKLGIQYAAKLPLDNLEKLALYPIRKQSYGFFESFPVGIERGKDQLVGYWKQLQMIFTPSTGAYKGVGGFKAIFDIFPAYWSWEAFWSITALLSIMLGVMNLLPIPALDGGHVMFLLYEIISRRKPSDKFMENAQMVGFVLLISLLLFANGNDIYKAIVGK